MHHGWHSQITIVRICASIQHRLKISAPLKLSPDHNRSRSLPHKTTTSGNARDVSPKHTLSEIFDRPGVNYKTAIETERTSDFFRPKTIAISVCLYLSTVSESGPGYMSSWNIRKSRGDSLLDVARDGREYRSCSAQPTLFHPYRPSTYPTSPQSCSISHAYHRLVRIFRLHKMAYSLLSLSLLLALRELRLCSNSTISVSANETRQPPRLVRANVPCKTNRFYPA